MSRLTVFALLALSTWFASNGTAQTRLAWQLKEKDQFFVEWKMVKLDRARNGSVIGETLEEIRLVARLRVLKADEDGYELEKTLGVVEYRNIGATKPNPLLGQLKGAVLRVQLDRELRVARIAGLEHLVGPKVGDGLLPHQKKQLEMHEQYLRTWYQHLFVKLPDGAVDPGATWTEKPLRLGTALYEQERAYRYRKDLKSGGETLQEIQISAKHRVIRDDSIIRVDDLCLDHAHYAGTALFDAASGRLRRARYESDLEGSAKSRLVPGGRPVNMFSAFSTTMTVAVSEENPDEAKPEPIKLAAHREPREDLPRVWTNSLGMKLVQLPLGKFTMGDKGFGALTTEEPIEVEITRPVHMGTHEVTIGQFRKFAEETGYKTEAERSPRGCFGWNRETKKLEMSSKYSWKNPGWDHDDNHPVVNLTWEDAKSFCQWLGKKEGKNYRMPTEAEWEFACRAGSRGAYCCGEDPETLVKFGNITDAAAKKVFPEWQCHRGDDGFVFTAPVGSFQPNAFGIHDLHGNALEYCEDWYFFYPTRGPIRDPQGPPLGFLKIQRGGSFADFPQHCTSSHRNSYPINNYCISSGFRVVCCEETPPLYHKPLTWVGHTVLPRNPDDITWIHKDNPRPFPFPAFGVVRDYLGTVNLNLPGFPALEKSEVLPREEAIAHYSTLLENAKTVRAYYLRGTAYFSKGDHDAALKDLNAAIDLDVENSWLYLERAKYHLARKEYAQAGQDYRKAVELKDNNAQLQNALAWFLATAPDKEQRDGKKAIEHARRARELSPPRDGNILDTLAAAYAEAGQFDEAIRCQQEALEDPNFLMAAGAAGRERLERYRRKEAFHQEAR